MKHPVHFHVSGVPGGAGDNGMGERILDAATANVANTIFFHVADARQCILDRVIPGAAAEVSLEAEGEVFLFLVGKTCRSHNHTRGAEPALECLRIEERLLHRVKRTVAGKSLDGFNFPSFRTKCWHEAAVDRFTVKPDRACTAVARVTALFYAEPSQITDKRAQALAGSRLGVKNPSIDFVAHGDFLNGELFTDLFREIVGKMQAVRG